MAPQGTGNSRAAPQATPGPPHSSTAHWQHLATTMSSLDLSTRKCWVPAPNSVPRYRSRRPAQTTKKTTGAGVDGWQLPAALRLGIQHANPRAPWRRALPCPPAACPQRTSLHARASHIRHRHAADTVVVQEGDHIADAPGADDSLDPEEVALGEGRQVAGDALQCLVGRRRHGRCRRIRWGGRPQPSV